MGVCIKALGPAVPLGQVVFFRSAFALIPLIAFLWWSGIFPSGLTTTRPLGHIFRCLMGAAAMFTSFATIRLLPLAEATMLSYLAPALMALMGWALLGERLGLRRLGGVAMGLAGGVVFGLPALSGNLPHGSLLGVALGVLTAVLTAGALIQVRRLTILGEGAGAIAFWFAVVSALAGAATLPLGWVQPDGLQLALLLGAGLAGGVAHILYDPVFPPCRGRSTRAFRVSLGPLGRGSWGDDLRRIAGLVIRDGRPADPGRRIRCVTRREKAKAKIVAQSLMLGRAGLREWCKRLGNAA